MKIGKSFEREIYGRPNLTRSCFSFGVPSRNPGLGIWSTLALLFANGKPIGGLNTFHQEHLITTRAVAGEIFTFDLEAVPHGLFGTPTNRPRVNLAALILPDKVLRSLLEDLAATHDTAKYLASIGREEIARRLIDAMDRAFAGIVLPRADTGSYLARIAATSKSRSLEDFYANAESLDSIWEEWQFTTPPAPLDNAGRRSLEKPSSRARRTSGTRYWSTYWRSRSNRCRSMKTGESVYRLRPSRS